MGAQPKNTALLGPLLRTPYLAEHPNPPSGPHSCWLTPRPPIRLLQSFPTPRSYGTTVDPAFPAMDPAAPRLCSDERLHLDSTVRVRARLGSGEVAQTNRRRRGAPRGRTRRPCETECECGSPPVLRKAGQLHPGAHPLPSLLWPRDSFGKPPNSTAQAWPPAFASTARARHRSRE